MKQLILALIPLTLLFSCGNEEKESKETNETIEDSANNEIEQVTSESEDVSFNSLDNLEISAKVYEVNPDNPMIVLCHQAGYNKFEYEGTAQRLNDMGFNCLAIDQRSGGPLGIYQNETFNRAMNQELGVDYLDAIPDITAAVDYAYNRSGAEVILWGSSYSSTLALWEGMKNEKVNAVVAFSPGDYFPELGSLTDSLSSFSKPFFITSSDNEIDGTDALLQNVQFGENQVQFKPEGRGHHGSRALWPNQLNGEQYWIALENWFNNLKN